MTRKIREAIAVALEAQARFKLRTSLSVLGIVLGVSAVIAMMSVTEGARRESLAQVQLLGIDNLVVRNRGLTRDESRGVHAGGLSAGDAANLLTLVPASAAVSPLVERTVPVAERGRDVMVAVVGIRPSYQAILALRADRGRLLPPGDGVHGSRACAL